jgi:deoxyribodipyrimidine photo-lyase
MPDRPIIVLFHRDLRVSDHPALNAAVETGAPIIPLIVYDETSPGPWVPGGASKWWWHHSIASLEGELEALGVRLILRRGPTVDVARDLITETNADGLYLSRGYEPWLCALEKTLHDTFASDDFSVRRFRGRLLFDPDHVRTKTGDIYKVYTPFWRAVFAKGVVPPLKAPSSIRASGQALASDDLASWELTPTKPNWAERFGEVWSPGRAGAEEKLDAFLADALADYDEARDLPGHRGTSRLSPHLHFGEISALEVWHRVLPLFDTAGRHEKGAETYLKELVWREFSYHLLYHFPHIPEAPFKAQFSAFPWREDDDGLRAWQRGRTGYPIVDAGMRELWATGWMHNRVRMIVGSFLTKNLLIPWQAGEAWFWDCLVDADLASNSASWQWVSGSGADAAPYFRIFNPITQSERYDPDGAYIRKWVPELKKLPNKHIHAPWQAPAEVLRAANVTLGKSYPQPILDHKETRERALKAYEQVKSTAS